MGIWSEWLQAVSERSHKRGRWLVRVFRGENDPKAVGAGLLVSESHVLTCAHVAGPSGPAPKRIWVDFPVVAGERREAKLAPRWGRHTISPQRQQSFDCEPGRSIRVPFPPAKT